MPPIQPMTLADYALLGERYPYYRGRARYMSTAARLAADLIDRKRLETALELGPHARPIVTGADALELDEREVPEGARSLIVHDARVTPWPFPDRAYDLFVGLQVFEHLGTSQRAAFTEVCRVARHAIISLPIEWVLEDTTDIHHGITNEQVLSWFAPRVPTRIIEGNPGPRARLIYVFEHLDRAPAAATAPPIERPAPPAAGRSPHAPA